MNYLKIYTDSISDGPGIRVSVYFAGCLPNKCKEGNCPGCHNSQAQKFNIGEVYTDRVKRDILIKLNKPYIKGLSILGGEPLDQDPEALLELTRCTKLMLNNKDIWVYTGYELKDILPGGKHFSNTLLEALKWVDVLVVGPFILEQRDISDANRWRGSRNQRVLDAKKSLKAGRPIMLENIPNNE